jgi:hypothetical protein
MRWLVERANGSFEDIGADDIQVVDGCLVFREEANQPWALPSIVIAAGQWISVCEAAD